MQRHSVTLSRDHLERQARCTPDAAIEELIWNGLDAGGDLVEVEFEHNSLGGLDTIRVMDHGAGIPFEDLERAFGTIGRSLKIDRKRNPDGRIFHGSEGRGRFKALVLGDRVRWRTTYEKQDSLLTYDIEIVSGTQDSYRTSDEPTRLDGGETGTEVLIEDVDHTANKLVAETTLQRLTERLALYLRQYPTVRVTYDRIHIDPAPLIRHAAEYPFEATSDSPFSGTLTVLEWNFQVPTKKLLLTDPSGFAWHEMLAGVHARDIYYTAYVAFKEARTWAEEGRFTVASLDPEVMSLVERAKDLLREHVRHRLAEEAQDLVRQWKDEEIYPYKEEKPRTTVEKAERQVFDIVAARVHRYHQPFRSGDKESRQLTLELVRQALENNPTSLRQILTEVLRLPRSQQDELAELLQSTTLEGMIRAAQAVRERLRAIAGFDEILFNEDWKSRLRERTQLHRLLVHQLWIFGEAYTLDADDERLRVLLKKHLSHLGRDLLAEEKSPSLIDGRDGIPDLMLSRVFRRDRDRVEHLVLELKRPSKQLGADDITQIKQYAYAVAEDERFSKTEVDWTFVLVGNDFDAFGEREANPSDRPSGCLDTRAGIKIWMRRWSDVLHQARSRYNFFSERLEMEALGDEGVAFLEKVYPKLMAGKGLTKKQEAEEEGQPPSGDGSEVSEKGL